MVRELGIAARLSVEGWSRLWLVAVLVFVAFRAATELTYPIYRDQAAYCMIGQSLLEGKVLYRDLWDNKPPGIFYLYAVTVKLFGPVMWSVGVIDLVCLFAISFFIFRFTKQYLGTAPAVVAVVFNTTWHVQGGNLYAAQPETFVVLFVFAGYFLVANKDGWAVFRNAGASGKWLALTEEAGLTARPPARHRGCAFGDLDGDGRPEIVIVNMNDVPSLLRNTGPVQNAIAVRLTGTKSNRSAINARITVEADGHRQMSEVVSGGSYYSQSSLRQYFGLGRATSIDHLEVRWPNGDVQKWSGLPANKMIALTEGQQQVVERPFSPRTATAAPPPGTPKKP